MIASRTERYICEGVGISGLAVLNPQIAYIVRRDLWSGALIAMKDFVWEEVRKFIESMPRVTIYEVRFVGSEDEWIPVAARSEDSLAERVTWLTGADVAAVRLFVPGRRAAEAKDGQPMDTDPLPDYPCTERTRILEERGERDIKFNKGTTFPPRRQGL